MGHYYYTHRKLPSDSPARQPSSELIHLPLFLQLPVFIPLHF
jgi:hypothetical protein